MGELTERDEDIIRVPDVPCDSGHDPARFPQVGRLLWKKSGQNSLPNCPECTAREKKKIREEYESSTPEEERNRDDLIKMFDDVEVPMKVDVRTKHFICKKCGLYATREQISDIRSRLNQKEYTKEDRQYDYQEWWSKSKKEKQEI